MIIVQLTFKAQKWLIQNRYLNILRDLPYQTPPHQLLMIGAFESLLKLLTKILKKIAYMKLFDMWPSALIGWNNINFHDLNT